MTSITRRTLFQKAARNLADGIAMPDLTSHLLVGPTSSVPSTDVLIVLFLRGAMDGLNMVIPYAENNYYAARPTIAIPKPAPKDLSSAIDLDGFFGLHPAMNGLKPIWDKGALAFVHASGSPDPTHSHFDAQDYTERGTPGSKQTPTGWLDRHLQTAPWQNPSPFRAVALSAMLPTSLQGGIPATAIPSIENFRLGGRKGDSAVIKLIASSLGNLYPANTSLFQESSLTFEAVQTLQKANPGQYSPANGAAYPQSSFGQGMKQIAQLIRANIGLEIATLDLGGWDTHIQEGGAQGQLAKLLADLGNGLAAFYQDLGDQFNHISVVAMSEFGRRVQENGNHGTDHGHGEVMLLMSNNLSGAKVFGQWPGLSQDKLYGPGDLAVTTDFRQVLSELVQNRLSNPHTPDVFPGFTGTNIGIFRT
jgi:uncharacterized protein (DUF1501 family)